MLLIYFRYETAVTESKITLIEEFYARYSKQIFISSTLSGGCSQIGGFSLVGFLFHVANFIFLLLFFNKKKIKI